jgi:branched-chain amino acid transport system ATP-binding protein
MSALLDVADISIGYRGVSAVRDLALTIKAGEIVTVIGANGAGKTTLLNGIMGLLSVKGQVRFEGLSIAHWEVERRVEAGMCLVPERRELFGAMSVADNLLLGGFRVDSPTRHRMMGEVYQRFPRLAERRSQLAATLSGGERQMLAMGRALMSKPRLLMLDEPSLGLAPRIVADIFAIIRELRESGVAILLVEQNARAALDVADRAYVMELGEVILAGPADQLAADPRVAASYLGVH